MSTKLITLKQAADFSICHLTGSQKAKARKAGATHLLYSQWAESIWQIGKMEHDEFSPIFDIWRVKGRKELHTHQPMHF